MTENPNKRLGIDKDTTEDLSAKRLKEWGMISKDKEEVHDEEIVTTMMKYFEAEMMGTSPLSSSMKALPTPLSSSSSSNFVTMKGNEESCGSSFSSSDSSVMAKSFHMSCTNCVNCTAYVTGVKMEPTLDFSGWSTNLALTVNESQEIYNKVNEEEGCSSGYECSNHVNETSSSSSPSPCTTGEISGIIDDEWVERVLSDWAPEDFDLELENPLF